MTERIPRLSRPAPPDDVSLFSFRVAGPDDVGGLVEMFRTVFGAQIDAETWRWKYSSGPARSALNVVAVRADGRPCGHMGAQLFQAKDGGVFAHCCDVMLDADVRGGWSAGVYAALLRFMQEQLAALRVPVMAFGFPGIKPARLGSMLGFYRQQERMRLVIRRDDGKTTGGMECTKRQWWRSGMRAVTVMESADSLTFSRNDLQPWKTPEHARWRYASHPRWTYRFLQLRVGWRRLIVVLHEQERGAWIVIDVLGARSPRELSRVLGAMGPDCLCAVGLAATRVEIPVSAGADTAGEDVCDTGIVPVRFLAPGSPPLDWAGTWLPGDTDVF